MDQPVFMPICTRGRHFYHIGHMQSKSTVHWASASFFILTVILYFLLNISTAVAASKRVIVLGDSLTSGYGLEGGQGFPEQLQISLQKEGLDVLLDNAGVSGDTTAGGLSRLDWTLQGDISPSLVIVALGANDMLRGLPVESSKQNLASILDHLQKKKIPTLLAGMRAPDQYPAPFQEKFDNMYAELADEFDVTLYPFFLEGVALNPDMNQADGIHPNQKGVAVMVKNMAPLVKKILESNNSN